MQLTKWAVIFVGSPIELKKQHSQNQGQVHLSSAVTLFGDLTASVTGGGSQELPQSWRPPGSKSQSSAANTDLEQSYDFQERQEVSSDDD